MDIVDGTNTCLINTTSGLNCTSDERLKTNITDLPTNTLDTLGKVRTVTYNWKSGPNSNQQIGFLAQDLEQYYPELVSTAPNGYLAVNYANMTPVLVESIRELNLKLGDIQNFATATDTTFLTSLQNWLASATNGIVDLFAKKIHTQELCVSDANGETCLDRTQVDQILGNSNSGSGSAGSPSPAVVTPPADSGSAPSGGGTQTPPVSDPVVTPPADDSSSSDATPPAVTAPSDSGATADPASAAPASDPAPSDDSAPAVSQ